MAAVFGNAGAHQTQPVTSAATTTLAASAKGHANSYGNDAVAFLDSLVVQRLIDEGANVIRVTADKLALKKTTQLLAVTIRTADNVALRQPTLTRAVILGRLVADKLAVAESGSPSVQIG
jgi:hypothetical protein